MSDTATSVPTEGPHHRPSAAELAKATKASARHAARRAEEIRAAPHLHRPKLVVSDQVRGESPLDFIAEAVNKFCGSMWVFLIISVGIVVWLFAGNFVGFDKTPWPLLLVILNLPQLSIMISLQVSANHAQAASDKPAVADHETLIALHEMAKRQLSMLEGQNKILDLLNNFASRDLPGTQQQILDTNVKILSILERSGPQGAGATA